MKKTNRRRMIGIGRAIKIRNRWLAEKPITAFMEGRKFPPISWTGARATEKPADGL